MKAVENIKNDLEETWKKIEMEIDLVTKKAKKLDLWKDFHYLYETMYKQPGEVLIGIHPKCNNHLIFKK